MSSKLPQLYDELASWWQLISPTSDYADEAAFFHRLYSEANAKTILELGAGGGNIGYYLKKDFTVTLTDLSPGMLEMSKKQNPECEHIVGDMRDIRLNKKFDGVFIHDAIMYITTVSDLLKVLETASSHLNPGGLLVIAPDCTKETLKIGTEYEGRDVGNRGVRYLQWITDPNPDDTQFNNDFIIALKESDELRTVIDRQVNGVFPRQSWLDLLAQAGYDTVAIPDSSTVGEANERIEVFMGTKS